MTDQTHPPAEADPPPGKRSFWGFLFGTTLGRVALIAGFMALASVAMMAILAAVILIFALVFLIFASQSFKSARRFADIPTSRIRSAAQGYVELNARAVTPDGAPLVSPLTNTPCHYWSLGLEVLRGSGKQRRWVSLAQARSARHLLPIADETGTCYAILHDPDLKGETTAQELSAFGDLSPVLPLFPDLDQEAVKAEGQWTLVEEVLPTDQPLFATGLFKTIRSNTSPFDEDWTTHALADGSGAPGFVKAMARQASELAAPYRDEANALWFAEMRKLEGIGPEEALSGSVLVHTLATDYREHSRTPLILASSNERDLVKENYRLAAFFSLGSAVAFLAAAGVIYNALDPVGFDALVESLMATIGLR